MPQPIESKLTAAQNAILATYLSGKLVIPLQDEPAILEADPIQYRGCGSGWVDIDDAGRVFQMRYAPHVNSPGRASQNVHMSEIVPHIGFRIASNRLRLFVNFSCWQADGIADVESDREPTETEQSC